MKNHKNTSVDSIKETPIDSIKDTPQNWEIYNNTESDDQFPKLVESVRKNGVLEPITISEDGFIRHNQGSRVKTDIELIAESAASMDPEEALAIVKARKQEVFDETQTSVEEVFSTGGNRRTNPLLQRGDFLEAASEIIDDHRERDLLPVTGRRIHYMLLAKAPLTSRTKRGHPYGTKKGDSGLLSKLLTDARSAGLIADSAIYDDTRVDSTMPSWTSVGDYLTDQMDSLFLNFFANVHRDQPQHVELIIEKNTLFPTLKKHVANKLRIPITSSRGFGSYPLSCKIRDRFKASGKEKLVVIFVTDHDPEGLCMPEAFLKYFEYDHGINADVRRAALTYDQILDFDLPHDAEAKPSSSRYDNYVKECGSRCWELDAIDVGTLIELVRDACTSCLDMKLLNQALEREEEADVKLARINKAVKEFIPQVAKQILSEKAS